VGVQGVPQTMKYTGSNAKEVIDYLGQGGHEMDDGRLVVPHTNGMCGHFYIFPGAEVLLGTHADPKEAMIIQPDPPEVNPLREALRFYADKKNHLRTGPQWDQSLSPVSQDGGEKARAALKGYQ